MPKPKDLPTFLDQRAIFGANRGQQKSQKGLHLYRKQTESLDKLAKEYDLANWQVIEMLLQAFETLSRQD